MLIKENKKQRRRHYNCRISSYPSEAQQRDLFYVYINDQFISCYITRKDARKKIFNYITRYKYCNKAA